MRPNRTLEIGTGLFVLLGFAALVFLTTQLPSSGLKLTGAGAGYTVTAEFDNVGDLQVGAPVEMAGVRIGEVLGIGINPQDYRALVTMRIAPTYNQIPDDSDASIDTQGLLGSQYVSIGAGGSEMYLTNGSRIQFTQPAIVLENLVNKLFASFAGKGSDSSSSGSVSSRAAGGANAGGNTNGGNSGASASGGKSGGKAGGEPPKRSTRGGAKGESPQGE
jgi:phospholipid/cholesterol/gamma-HCH transport system substrate-binding protein